MDTLQTDLDTMYRLVVNQYLPSEAAAPLLAVPLVAKLRAEMLATLGLVVAAAEAQDHPSTGLSRTREAVKHEAAVRADIVRQLVLLFPPSATAEVELKHSPLNTVNGDEKAFLAYLQRILDYLPDVTAEDRALAGYDKQVGPALAADLQQLATTVGQVRQAINTSSSAGTDTLETLFDTLAKQARQLDRAAKMQRLALPTVVADYFKARRVLHTQPKRRRQTLKGAAHFGVPAVVLDRTQVPLLSLTLANRSARGYTLGYYVADTPTALPQPGQVVHTVKRNRPWHMENFAELGPDSARYLLVLLQQQGPDGAYYVQG